MNRVSAFRISAFLFGLAALVPAAFIHAAARLPGDVLCAVAIAGAALVVVFLVHRALAVARKRSTIELDAEQIKPVGGEALAVFVTYALSVPALALDPSTVTFAAIFLVLLARSRLVVGNPLLLLLGYVAFEVETTSRVTYVVLRKRNDYAITSTNVKVTKLLDLCYLECPE